MSEDEIMEIKYISGIQPFMDEDGQTVLAVSWVECPMMKTKRITMRTAASRETAERFCRDLMKLLGIQEQPMEQRVAMINSGVAPAFRSGSSLSV